MNKLSKFLHKIFFVVLVFGCCAFFGAALAEDTTTTEQTLCPKGSYLASCNNKVLGTEWLKGLRSTTATSQTGQTSDYYSYGNDQNATNTNNLRKFFAGKVFSYYNKNGELLTTLESEVKENRNIILTEFCGGGNSIECEKCPGDASVEASTIQKTTNGENSYENWRVHTIVDCYMKEFSDNTGTYKYVSNTQDQDEVPPAVPCYYSINTPGDSLWSAETEDATGN